MKNVYLVNVFVNGNLWYVKLFKTLKEAMESEAVQKYAQAGLKKRGDTWVYESDKTSVYVYKLKAKKFLRPKATLYVVEYTKVLWGEVAFKDRYYASTLSAAMEKANELASFAWWETHGRPGRWFYIGDYYYLDFSDKIQWHQNRSVNVIAWTKISSDDREEILVSVKKIELYK